MVVVQTITKSPEVHANSFCLRVRHGTIGFLLRGAGKCCGLISKSWDEVNQITQDVVDITQNVLQQAELVIEKLQRTKKLSVEAQEQKLQSLVDKTKQLLDQAKQVISGNRIIPDRIISIHDPEARPIKKGKLAKKVEFGYKVRIDETESGFVTGYAVYTGNPSDDDLLVPAVQHHQEVFGSAPHAVAASRGFSSRKNERVLQEELGIQYVSTPFRGKKSKARAELEQEHWYKRRSSPSVVEQQMIIGDSVANLAIDFAYRTLPIKCCRIKPCCMPHNKSAENRSVKLQKPALYGRKVNRHLQHHSTNSTLGLAHYLREMREDAESATTAVYQVLV